MSPDAKITFAIPYTCGGKIQNTIKIQITLINKLQNYSIVNLCSGTILWMK